MFDRYVIKLHRNYNQERERRGALEWKIQIELNSEALKREWGRERCLTHRARPKKGDGRGHIDLHSVECENKLKLNCYAIIFGQMYDFNPFSSLECRLLIFITGHVAWLRWRQWVMEASRKKFDCISFRIALTTTQKHANTILWNCAWDDRTFTANPLTWIINFQISLSKSPSTLSRKQHKISF